MRKPHPRSQYVPAVPGVRQAGERGRELDRHFSLGRDADRLVAEPLARLAVRLEEPAPGFPPRTPLGLGELRRIEVVTGAQQASAAAHDMHPARFPVGPNPVEPVLQHMQPPRLVEPLVRGAVAARSPLGALLADRQRQPVPERRDTGFEGLHVCGLATPGERPLIMRGPRDRPGPPGRRLGRQVPLTGRPGPGGVLQAVQAPRFEVLRGERAQVRTHQAQNLLVLGREVFEAGADRHTGRAGHDERLRDLPQTTHPDPPPPPASTTRSPRPTNTTGQGHAFDGRTPLRRLATRHGSPRRTHHCSPMHARTHSHSAKPQQFPTPVGGRVQVRLEDDLLSPSWRLTAERGADRAYGLRVIRFGLRPWHARAEEQDLGPRGQL